MLATIIIAIIFGAGGWFVAALWTMVYGFASLPGNLIAGPIDTGERGPRWWIGLFIAFLCMLYTQAAFMVLVLGGAVSIISVGYKNWPIWIAAFCVSLAPPLIAGHDRAARQDEPSKLADVANALIELLMIVLFFVLLYVPIVVKLWSWVPFSFHLIHK